jgi:hypothetical protein
LILLAQHTRFPTDPQSQSFSQSYGSILPTSLTYIILSTRGCSPWRPAAVISTTNCEGILPQAFHGPSGVSRTRHRDRAFPTTKPHRRLTRFHGAGPLKRKENSSRGSCQRRLVHLRCRVAPHVGAGILTSFPFDRSAQLHCATELPHLLGSTHPRPTAVPLEPFSTSVFKVSI